MKPQIFHRTILWAAHFHVGREKGFVPYEAWHTTSRPRVYLGEPQRAMLFRTRKECAVWCKEKREASKKHSKHWYFKPIRVEETLTAI